MASVLKLWLRELPDPLLTYELHNGFLEAASTPVFPCWIFPTGLTLFFSTPQEMKTIDSDIFGYMRE